MWSLSTYNNEEDWTGLMPIKRGGERKCIYVYKLRNSKENEMTNGRRNRQREKKKMSGRITTLLGVVARR